MGLWRDHSLKVSLALLLGNQRGATIGASAIEDAALILYSDLADSGYLEPTVTVIATTAGGRVEHYALDPNLEPPLPRPLQATAVEFQVKKGRRFDINTVVFHGLTALRPDQARTYFRAEGILATMAAERAYSPERLRRAAGNLLDELRRRGYAEAIVTAPDPTPDPRTGRVNIVVDVHQGPLWIVRDLELRLEGPGPAVPPLGREKFGRPWSDWWRHDAETQIRRWYYDRGYADVRVRIETGSPTAARGGERGVVAQALVRPGPAVRLGSIRYEGNTRTHTSVLRPLVKAKPGEPLNPTTIQAGQYRISRLGVFSGVNVVYDPPQGPVRDAVYQLKEGKKQDVDLLLGWGSFEELRGGVEWHDYDLFNLAHEGTLKVVQSLKSSEGEYDYSIPEIGGSNADLTAKLFGFRRNERAFVDEQYGTTVSLATPIPQWGSELLVGYTFDRLKAANDTLRTVLTDITNASATSVQATLTRDKRDNPLLPRQGYKVSFQVVEASKLLGGQVDFQQFELAASYHTPWGHSRWIHIGFSHDLITTYGQRVNTTLPPNIFFYPGGEDSIRGYNQGEAAPRDPVTGQYLPTKTQTLLNLELEQALTSKFSLVLFNDDLGASASMHHYPFDYRLYTVGLGLRYQTIVGPIRLEYGRNLNPRRNDPQGALQFSVGFPF